MWVAVFTFKLQILSPRKKTHTRETIEDGREWESKKNWSETRNQNAENRLFAISFGILVVHLGARVPPRWQWCQWRWQQRHEQQFNSNNSSVPTGNSRQRHDTEQGKWNNWFSFERKLIKPNEMRNVFETKINCRWAARTFFRLPLSLGTGHIHHITRHANWNKCLLLLFFFSFLSHPARRSI